MSSVNELLLSIFLRLRLRVVEYIYILIKLKMNFINKFNNYLVHFANYIQSMTLHQTFQSLQSQSLTESDCRTETVHTRDDAPCRVGSVGSVSASHTIGREFASRPGHTKDHHKNATNCLPALARNALGKEFGSAAQLSKRPGSVWNCLWGHALKISPGIIRKSRVSYPGPGFLSSATSLHVISSNGICWN